MKETAAIINAITGNTGYKGTLKGRIIPGSFFLNCKRETMDIIYKVKGISYIRLRRRKQKS